MPSLAAFEAEGPRLMGDKDWQANYQKIGGARRFGLPRNLHHRRIAAGQGWLTGLHPLSHLERLTVGPPSAPVPHTRPGAPLSAAGSTLGSEFHEQPAGVQEEGFHVALEIDQSDHVVEKIGTRTALPVLNQQTTLGFRFDAELARASGRHAQRPRSRESPSGGPYLACTPRAGLYRWR